MKHIIRIAHQLTEDERYVYLSCEENGKLLFVSDQEKNGTFHLIQGNGAPLRTHPIRLLDAATQSPVFSFTPEKSPNKYSGMITAMDNIPCGSISSVGHGSERYYAADLGGHHYDCYTWAVGTNPCVMFYRNGTQCAMLVEDKLSIDQRYSMTMHITDGEDVAELCVLGMICHLFENVYNMNSRFHRSFMRNGYSIAFAEHTANYYFEVPLFGAGKSKYDIQFLRQFYPEDCFPYQDGAVTAKSVAKELGHGLHEAAGNAWTAENLKTTLLKPVTIILLVGVPVLFGIIGCFVGPLFLLSFGINAHAYGMTASYVIGFLTFFGIAGGGELIFLLFFFLLTKLVRVA